MDSAGSAGVDLVPTRAGGPPIAALRPIPRESAHRASLSARFGLGALPLHTDGAHLVRPPNVVLLEASAHGNTEDRVSTLLLRVRPRTVSPDLWHALGQGVFHVRAQGGFLSSVRTGMTIRFDPGCMAPLDPVARGAYRDLQRASGKAIKYSWGRGRILIIDNTSVVHGREPAPLGSERVLRRVMMRWPAE